MSFPGLGSRFTDTHTATEGAKNQLGQVAWDKGKAYKYVKNVNASAMTAARLCIYDLTADDGYSVDVPGAANAKHVAGVTVSAIPASGFGWILVHGYGLCRFDGAGTATTAGNPVQTFGTAGLCQGVDVTVATQVASAVGVALDTTSSTSDLEVFVRGVL